MEWHGPSGPWIAFDKPLQAGALLRSGAEPGAEWTNPSHRRPNQGRAKGTDTNRPIDLDFGGRRKAVGLKPWGEGAALRHDWTGRRSLSISASSRSCTLRNAVAIRAWTKPAPTRIS